MANKKRNNSSKDSTAINIQAVAAAAEAEKPIEIDISKYDRTENLEMTNPAHKTMQISDNIGKPLEMTQVPLSELGTIGTVQEEESDEPYSPDSLGKPKKSSRPTHTSAEGSEKEQGEHTHHHHHSSESSGEHTHHHHHHSSESSGEHTHHHHHHSSESSGEHTHRSSSSHKAAAAGTKSADKPEKKKKSKKTEVKPLKSIFKIANIVYPAAVFAVTAVLFIALPRPDTSETEQRALAKFPEFSADSLLNGEYTNGITEFFNDAVPFRDELKKAAAQVRGLFGISGGKAGIDEVSGPIAVITEEEEPEEPVIVTTTQAVTTAPVTEKKPVTEISVTTSAEETAAAPETTPPETTAAPVETTKNVNEIAEGVITNGQVVTKLSDGHWWAMSLFGGGKGTAYAAALNAFREALGENVTVYSMVVPTAGEYYLPDTYSAYSASHQKSIDSIASQLSGVIDVPASMALWKHTAEPIYTRTDHHWQPLGAYYAAQSFAEAAGVPFADISTMERVDVPDYMGTMYSFTESANLLSDPETFTYYKPSNNYTTYYYNRSYEFDYQLPFFVKMPKNGSYSTFMGGDDKIVRITTDAGTGRKLVVFKDSYGNAEIPFYFGSFDEIWVCDMRYFDLNAVEFVEFTGATDLLFTMCTFSAVGTNANHLQTILNNPVTGITEPLNR